MDVKQKSKNSVKFSFCITVIDFQEYVNSGANVVINVVSHFVFAAILRIKVLKCGIYPPIFDI